MYPEGIVRPMREELTRLGVQELRTPAQVDEVLGRFKGTLMVVVNSICGFAGVRMRPAVRLALEHPVRPEKIVTVFAGQDKEATERARTYFSSYPPSSPAIALFCEGKLVHFLQRCDIETRSPEEIAADLTAAFDRFCAVALQARAQEAR